MLDDDKVLKQRDPSDALAAAAAEFQQASYSLEVKNDENDGRSLSHIVVVGMGGSGLGAVTAKAWLKEDITLPLEIVRTYTLPGYVGSSTLVVVNSYSGNTEEALAALKEAHRRDAQIAIITSGGELKKIADDNKMATILLPSGLSPRMTLIYGLRALTSIFVLFGILPKEKYEEIAEQASWLKEQTQLWTSDVSTAKNYAKQLALLSVGKTPVFYAGNLMAPIAYKWKISWNENAKNVAFWNEYPEFNHNEFIGWTSHPVEKPFAVFNLISNFEHPRVLKRFEISERLLSGKCPKPIVVNMEGDTAIAQMLWGSVLADFVSIYVAILNGVDPTPVALIEKLKVALED